MIQTGTIKKVLAKEWDDKTFYSLILHESDKIFGLGSFRTKAKEGDSVKFEATPNAKGYLQVNTKTLEVTPGVEGTHVAVSAKSAVRASNGLSKDDYWFRKNERDIRQDELREIGATRNTAVEWLKFLIQTESLKLPAKIADKEAALNALLEDYINKFRGLAKPVKVTYKQTAEKEENKQSDISNDESDGWDKTTDASP